MGYTIPNVVMVWYILFHNYIWFGMTLLQSEVPANPFAEERTDELVFVVEVIDMPNLDKAREGLFYR